MQQADPQAAPAAVGAPTAPAASTAATASGTSAAPGVQSVERAFALLDALANAERELPLAELAATVGLPQPTAHRLLRTLQSLGHVRQLESRSYALGAGLIALGQRAAPPLAERARSALVRLEELVQETANLAVLDGDLARYIAQVPSRHRMRMFTEVGRGVLPHASGVGKAMLATLPDARVRQLVSRTGLPAYTPTTLATPEALLADLRQTRRRGFALDDGEQEVGVRCIAVAIPRPPGEPPAAVSVSGPSTRVTEDVVASLAPELARIAAGLGDER